MSVPNDHRAVMQRGLVPEKILQQLRRHGGIQHGAGFDDIVQRDLSLKDHQRAHLILGEGRIGLYRLCDGVLHVGRRLLAAEHIPQPAAAQLLQETADLRLKDHNQRQRSHLYHTAQHEVDHSELQQVGETQRHQQQQNGFRHLGGPAALDQHQYAINDVGDDRHIEYVKNGNVKSQDVLPHPPQQFSHFQCLPHLRVCTMGGAKTLPAHFKYYTVSSCKWQELRPLIFP